MVDSQNIPHIAFAVFSEVQINELRGLLKEFTAKQSTIDLNLSYIGTFPTDEGVVFLAPKVSAELLDVHKNLHKLFSNYSFSEKQWDYYKPELWVPHCTMAIKVSESKALEALKYLKSVHKPQKLILEKMLVLEYNEEEESTNELLSFSLGKSK
jgi:2'-5' RNA ligase